MHGLTYSITSNLVTYCLVDVFSLSQIFPPQPCKMEETQEDVTFHSESHKRKEYIRCKQLGILPPQDLCNTLMRQTFIYFLCPIYLPPVSYVPIESHSQQHLMLAFTSEQKQRVTFSKLPRFDTAHTVNFVNCSQPLEALSHCFLSGQLLNHEPCLLRKLTALHLILSFDLPNDPMR